MIAEYARGMPRRTRTAGPARRGWRPDTYTDRFFDDFIFELCGIETFTTLTERWTFKEFADGSVTLHVVRTFVPDDPGIPIEKGAGTSFIAPDGTRRVVGKPIQLIGSDGGVRILDAGWIELDEQGNVLAMRGPHPSYGIDLTPYYCP
jgi:hypothetical protein